MKKREKIGNIFIVVLVIVFLGIVFYNLSIGGERVNLSPPTFPGSCYWPAYEGVTTMWTLNDGLLNYDSDRDGKGDSIERGLLCYNGMWYSTSNSFAQYPKVVVKNAGEKVGPWRTVNGQWEITGNDYWTNINGVWKKLGGYNCVDENIANVKGGGICYDYILDGLRVPHWDVCVGDNKVWEVSCGGDNFCSGGRTVPCDSGQKCQEVGGVGVCVAEEVESVPGSCSDTDSLNDMFARGVCVDYINGVRTEHPDECEGNIVKQYECDAYRTNLCVQGPEPGDCSIFGTGSICQTGACVGDRDFFRLISPTNGQIIRGDGSEAERIKWYIQTPSRLLYVVYITKIDEAGNVLAESGEIVISATDPFLVDEGNNIYSYPFDWTQERLRLAEGGTFLEPGALYRMDIFAYDFQFQVFTEPVTYRYQLPTFARASDSAVSGGGENINPPLTAAELTAAQLPECRDCGEGKLGEKEYCDKEWCDYIAGVRGMSCSYINYIPDWLVPGGTCSEK